MTDLLEKLKDPNAVHLNMLNGTIAKPSVEQIKHIYGDQLTIEHHPPRPLDEWHEDMGPVLWWKFPIEEPPYVGTPLDLGFPIMLRVFDNNGVEISGHGTYVGAWPGYHTHWTPLPALPPEPDTIHVPWTPAEVELLEKHQADGSRPPYTCPGNDNMGEPDCPNRDLTPTVGGWVCDCGKYRQTWAYNPRKMRKLP